MAHQKRHLFVCSGIGCRALESEKIRTNLQQEIILNGLSEDVQVVATGCFGFCEKGPLVKILPDNTFYVQVGANDAKEIVQEHLLNNRKVERLLYINPLTKERITREKDMDFYKKQYR